MSRSEAGQVSALKSRLVILPGSGCFPAGHVLDCDIQETTAFISIGAGETHVSVMSVNAERLMGWVAVFGWTHFNRLALIDNSPIEIVLEDEVMMGHAFTGRVLAYGIGIDTSGYLARVETGLRSAVSEILDRTIGTGVRIASIRLAAPVWMHEVLSRSVEGLRPNISSEILEID